MALEFLECMAEELKKLFEGMVFERPSGGTIGMHIFKQDFPIRKYSDEFDEEQEDEEDAFFPYCVIRVEDGIAEQNQTVDITLSFGICERSEENNGELRILNLIGRVCKRFLNDRIIGGKFRLSYDSPIKWGLPSKEAGNTYPYFYGLMEMTWNSFFEVEEDRYV